MKLMLYGVTAISLLALLIGCGTSQPQIIRVPFERTVIEKVRTPEELLRQSRTPDLDSLKTNGDLETRLGEALISLETCNKDKARIKEWQEAE